MIARKTLFERVIKRLKSSPVVALLGPRQCGKSTLAREIVRNRGSHFFDLEYFPDQSLLEQPIAALESLRGLIVIDEIQRNPGLLPLIRVLADRKPLPARFLLLGSASPDLVRGTSESLAGRVAFVEMGGFNPEELGKTHLSRLWLRGGFPRSFLARSDSESFRWRQDFARTFLERDLPASLNIRIPPATLRRFWSMLSHYHGQVWNGAELARSMGVSEKTVQGYLDLLTGSFMIRQLQPWFANVGKRQVRSPKIFFRDTGLLHAFLNLPDRRSLLSHPRLGASWEGFALELALRLVNPDEAYFWATHAGAELDLLFFSRGRPFGVECKFSDAPKVTKSMAVAIKDLELAGLWVVYPGKRRYRLATLIEALPIADLKDLLRNLAQHRK